MNAPTKLGLALILIFSTCLLALFIELLYVLWRKRTFRQRSIVTDGPRSIDSEYSNSPFNAAPSKELLYFFCWKNQAARVEPSSGVVSPSPKAPDSEAPTVEEDDDDEEVLAKWQALYGQSRILYTIKEEEREGIESVDIINSSAVHHPSEAKRDCFLGGSKSCDDVAISVVDTETPFTTPCASPPYFTPSPSPDRGGRDFGIFVFSPEFDDVSSPGNDGLSSTDGEFGFVSLRIEG